MGYDINVAIHEAGHAVVLASLGYASEIEYVTVITNFVPAYLAALYEALEKREGIKLPSFTEHSTGHIRRLLIDGECKSLPLAVEVPFLLSGRNCTTAIRTR
jgi:hypothetical protein